VSYSIHSANRGTHLRIALVSLIASIIVVGLGIAAAPRLSNTSQLEATAQDVLKAGKPVTWTSSESAVIR
jgi:hypothetical protein